MRSAAIRERFWLISAVFLAVVTLIGAGCGPAPSPTPEGERAATLQVGSSAFEDGGPIPVQYTCDGEDLSPPLYWSDAPQGIESLVLIVDDPDAPSGIWVHWVLYDIPASRAELPESVAKDQVLEGIGTHGISSFGGPGYGGPCPPPGKPHRYFFKLYALDTRLDLNPGASKSDLESAMQGHILAEGQLMGTYGR